MSLLVNPDSFCETAENFFDLSFLVKDARATVGVDDSTGRLRVSFSRSPGRRGAQDPGTGGIIDGGLQPSALWGIEKPQRPREAGARERRRRRSGTAAASSDDVGVDAHGAYPSSPAGHVRPAWAELAAGDAFLQRRSCFCWRRWSVARRCVGMHSASARRGRRRCLTGTVAPPVAARTARLLSTVGRSRQDETGT